MSRIYFSIQEANTLIKRIKPQVDRLFELNEQLQLLDNTKIEFDEDSTENFLLEVELNKNFHEKNVELYTLLGDLIREGCVVRDLEKMEIDFYSKHNKKEILLCWRPLEEQILFWHYLGEDVEKRKSIKQLQEEKIENLKKLV
ncbi:MAG: DUF2203 family protein [Candidatus ainarchaeum sp.]|nr:DUF2203 family protein [Candidatus ainarchaeum sp.]